MDDILQAEKNTQSAAKNSGCCGAAPGIRILETTPIPEPPKTPCCGANPGETMASDGAIGTDRSSGVLKSTSFWGWGFAGLIGIAIMAAGTDCHGYETAFNRLCDALQSAAQTPRSSVSLRGICSPSRRQNRYPS